MPRSKKRSFPIRIKDLPYQKWQRKIIVKKNKDSYSNRKKMKISWNNMKRRWMTIHKSKNGTLKQFLWSWEQSNLSNLGANLMIIPVNVVTTWVPLDQHNHKMETSFIKERKPKGSQEERPSEWVDHKSIVNVIQCMRMRKYEYFNPSLKKPDLHITFINKSYPSFFQSL